MIKIVQADLKQPEQAQALVELMDEYARHPMGQGKPLDAAIKKQLPQALQGRADSLQLLAFDGERPVGLVNCFEGFSTFACKPLINVHDVIVAEEYRGKGLARKLLAKVEEIARARGCCKLTLEVLEGNLQAQKTYQALGFAGYQLDPQMGQALFWEKKL